MNKNGAKKDLEKKNQRKFKIEDLKDNRQEHSILHTGEKKKRGPKNEDPWHVPANEKTFWQV